MESPMFEIVDVTQDALPAIRFGHGSLDGYRALYAILGKESGLR